MLQEVEQTVDDVVIITNGRLVKQGAMADLHGDAKPIVRTTDADALAGALRVADVDQRRSRTARSSSTPPTCG